MKCERLVCCAVIALTFAIVSKCAINSYMSVYGGTICTNGLSTMEITSDYAIWCISITNETKANVKDVQTKRNADKKAVLNFLKQHDLDGCIVEEDFRITDNWQNRDSSDNKDKPRFVVTDKFRIKSSDISKIKKVVAETGEVLLSAGINVSNHVRYIYSHLDELRLEMIEEAARDSRNRAEHIAQTSGCKIKKIISLETGKFSITPDDTNEVTADPDRWYYRNDDEGETSLKKRIRVVVHGSYRIA